MHVDGATAMVDSSIFSVNFSRSVSESPWRRALICGTCSQLVVDVYNKTESVDQYT